MRHGCRIGRAEEPPSFECLPIFKRRRHNAVADHGSFFAHPNQLAVFFINLDKRVHIGADVVFIGVIAANALEIVFENLVHKGFFRLDFFFR